MPNGISNIARTKCPRLEAERKFAEMGEPLKCELIEDKGGDVVSCYTIEGTPFVDFCLGPHIPSTGENKSVQAAFDCRCALARRRVPAADAAHLRHCILYSGRARCSGSSRRKRLNDAITGGLASSSTFSAFSELVGSGLALWHPNGAQIRRVIEGFLDEELYRRGYSMVNTPHITAVRTLSDVRAPDELQGDALSGNEG